MNATTELKDDEVQVTVAYGDGAEGAGWYVHETEYPDEGFVGFFDHEPSAEEIAALCPEYRR